MIRFEGFFVVFLWGAYLFGFVDSKAHFSNHIVLAHRWPISECTNWMQANVSNKCNVPPTNDWIVGGFWPLRFHANLPVNCNKSKHADDIVLKQLSGSLQSHWPSIYSNVTNLTLWKKEYVRHGSCAVTLKVFNDTEHYFKGALQRLSKVNVTEILKRENIFPGSHYSVNRILNAVKKAFKPADVQPAMKCITHEATKGLMLRDIYTCYDIKQGILIGCEKLKGGFFDGCSNQLDMDIIYYPSREYPLPHKFSRALIAFLIILFGTLSFVGAFFGYKKYQQFKNRQDYDSVPNNEEE